MDSRLSGPSLLILLGHQWDKCPVIPCVILERNPQKPQARGAVLSLAAALVSPCQ